MSRNCYLVYSKHQVRHWNASQGRWGLLEFAVGDNQVHQCWTLTIGMTERHLAAVEAQALELSPTLCSQVSCERVAYGLHCGRSGVSSDSRDEVVNARQQKLNLHSGAKLPCFVENYSTEKSINRVLV